MKKGNKNSIESVISEHTEGLDPFLIHKASIASKTIAWVNNSFFFLPGWTGLESLVCPDILMTQ